MGRAAAAAGRALRQSAVDPGSGGHRLHVLHRRAVRRADPGRRADAAARRRLHRRGVQGLPGARGCGLRPLATVAAGAVGQSPAHGAGAGQRGPGFHGRPHARLPPDDRTALRVRQPRSRYRAAGAAPPHLRHDEAARSGDRIPDLADDAQDFDGTIRLGVSYGASSIEFYQDYGGFPLVADTRLRQWAAMLERNSGEPAR